MIRASSTLTGILAVLVAWFAFSLNDVGIKLLSGDYALHQITLIRTIVAIVITVVVIMPFDGGLSNIRTQQPFLNLARGLCLVCSNMAFYLGIATLSLPESMAIFFVAPLFITVLSVVVLNEQVGPRRWAAVVVGLIGVLVMMRLGADSFKPAVIFPLLSGMFYSILQIMTRITGVKDKASTMSFYNQLMFIFVSTTLGLTISDGRFLHPDYPTLDFVLREWVRPESGDLLIMMGLGVASAAGGFLISLAYRITEATLIAPFEYMALVYSIFWSAVIWQIWPTGTDWIGIVLIIGSGLYIWKRETF